MVHGIVMIGGEYQYIAGKNIHSCVVARSNPCAIFAVSPPDNSSLFIQQINLFMQDLIINTLRTNQPAN